MTRIARLIGPLAALFLAFGVQAGQVQDDRIAASIDILEKTASLP